MSDDPHKKHVDSWFVSRNQDYEVATFKAAIRKQKPEALLTAIDDAFNKCCAEIAPSEGREKLTACVLKKLK